MGHDPGTFYPPEVYIIDVNDDVVWVGEESDEQLRDKNLFGEFDCPGGTSAVHTARFAGVPWDNKGYIDASVMAGNTHYHKLAAVSEAGVGDRSPAFKTSFPADTGGPV